MKNWLTYEWDGKVILLVEDEPMCRLFFKSAFQNTKVIFFFAYNGEDAISMVKELPEIDLVLMDIKLPLMNGLEATRQIKQIRPDLPIIAQTAYAMNNDRIKAIEAGCDDYVSKPIQLDVLMDKIETFFMTS